MRFLPTKIHGVLDYIVGIALILAPNLFRFSAVGGAAVWIPRVLGVGLILYSVFTKYELGLIKVLPMGYHLVVDFVAAAFLTASPFLFGFTHHGLNAWLPHVVVGVAVIAVVLVSQTQPGASVVGSDHAAPSPGEPYVAPAPQVPQATQGARRPGSFMPGATEADRRAELASLYRPSI